MNIAPIVPGLLVYHDIGPLVIRLIVGVTLLYFGFKKVKHHSDSSGSTSPQYGIVEILVALTFILGVFTQLAAILNIIILVIKLGFKWREGKLFKDGVNYYVLLLAMVVSLLFTGPGAYALDTTL